MSLWYWTVPNLILLFGQPLKDWSCKSRDENTYMLCGFLCNEILQKLRSAVQESGYLEEAGSSSFEIILSLKIINKALCGLCLPHNVHNWSKNNIYRESNALTFVEVAIYTYLEFNFHY